MRWNAPGQDKQLYMHKMCWPCTQDEEFKMFQVNVARMRERCFCIKPRKGLKLRFLAHSRPSCSATSDASHVQCETRTLKIEPRARLGRSSDISLWEAPCSSFHSLHAKDEVLFAFYNSCGHTCVQHAIQRPTALWRSQRCSNAYADGNTFGDDQQLPKILFFFVL